MRKADLLTAILLAVFSIYLAIKSQELPITWDPDMGPGGGVFPFWLSVIMFFSAVTIIIRWFMQLTPLSRSTQAFFEQGSISLILLVVGLLLALVGLMSLLGTYVAVAAFLMVYLRVFGHHDWLKVMTISVSTPVILFFLFDIAMRINLPKGYTEPLFYPLYDLFY